VPPPSGNASQIPLFFSVCIHPPLNHQPLISFSDSSDDEAAGGGAAAEGQDNGDGGGLARRTRARLTLGDTFDFNKADEELGAVVQLLEDDNKTQALKQPSTKRIPKQNFARFLHIICARFFLLLTAALSRRAPTLQTTKI
jgi:hypothetical protein